MKLRKNIILSIAAIVVFFAIAESVTRLFIPPGSYDYIERRAIEQNLSHKKAGDEFRILFYGESTMHGNQLYPKSTIDKWVKLYLKDLLPADIADRVTTANFGRLGAGSEFISESVIETLSYKPDLIVVYMAHNDFVLVPIRRAFFRPKTFGERLEEFLEEIPKKSSFANAINRAYIKHKINANANNPNQSFADDAWYSENTQAYYTENDFLVPGSAHFTSIRKEFEKNSHKIIKAAKDKNAPLVIFEAVSRWKGYEPVEPGEGRALDYYRIGEDYERQGNPKEANRYYELANDSDYFPIRAPSCVNSFYETIRESGAGGIHVIQTQKVFEQNSKNGIIDEELILDPVHPTMEGQALMALELVKIIYDKDMFAPKNEWNWVKARGFEAMKKNLDFDEESEFIMYLTSAQYVEKKYDKAAEFLEEAVKIKPDSIFANSWLAFCYSKMGQKEKAEEIYKKLSFPPLQKQ